MITSIEILSQPTSSSKMMSTKLLTMVLPEKLTSTLYPNLMSSVELPSIWLLNFSVVSLTMPNVIFGV